MLQSPTKSLSSTASVVPVSTKSHAIPLSKSATAGSSLKLTFTAHDHAKAFKVLADRDSRDYFAKWGLVNHMYLKRFSYDQYVPEYMVKEFLHAFLSDQGVMSDLKVMIEGSKWASLGQPDLNSLKYKSLAVTSTDLTLFDGLFRTGVVRRNGGINKCLDEVIYLESEDGGGGDAEFVISDELQRCLLDPVSEHYATALTGADREELLFHLLMHLVLGGEVNQFEDELGPYTHMARLLYKDMVRYYGHAATLLVTVTCSTEP